MKTLILALGVLFSFQGICQNAYYDALKVSAVDTSNLRKVLLYGKYHFLTSKTFVPAKNVQFRDIRKKNLSATNVKFVEENGDFVVKYDLSDGSANQSISLTALSNNSKLKSKYELLDLTTNNTVKVSKRYVLSDYEIEQIENMIKFVANPFHADLKKIDFGSINLAIDKFNEYATYLNIPRQNQVLGFSPLALASSAQSVIGNVLSGDFSMSEEDQTKIIDGLVKYIAEEFKRAQTASYMNVFEKTFGQVGEFQVLFPKTYAKLKSADPTKFPDLGGELKEIFSQDFKGILDNLSKHIAKYDSTGNDLEQTLSILKFENVDTIRKSRNFESFKIATDVSSKLIHNYHPVDLFHYLDQNYYSEDLSLSDAELEKRIGYTLHGLNLIQRNFLDTNKTAGNRFSNVWLNYEQLRKLNTVKKKEYFLALIYMQDTAYFNDLFSITGLNRTADQIKKIKKQLEESLNKILPVLIELQDFRANLDEENLKDNFEDYLRLVLRVIEAGTEDDSALDKFFIVSENVIDIYENIRDKDYGNTIFHVSELIELFLVDIDVSMDANLRNVLEKIDRYGSFMSAVVKTENSDEMKKVIKTFVAPPASYVFKRQHNWTASVTAHPGYFFGLEANKQFPDPKFISGLTLPISLDFSIKIDQSKRDESASFGISAQLLDLGAILNFRVDNDSISLPDMVNLKQLFSPGISLNYGFKNSPMTIGFGYQFTPQLRTITVDNGNEILPQYHRLSLRLSWDLPLLFLGKSKKYSSWD